MSTPVPNAPLPPPGRQRWWLLAGVVLLLVGLVAWALVKKRQGEEVRLQLQAAAEANSRGVGLMEQFNYDDAAVEFRAALELAPEWLPARINLGLALYNSASAVDDPALMQATTQFREVLKVEPGNPYAHFNLGIITKYQGRFDEAQANFREVLAVDPSDDRAWLYLAQSNIRSQEDPESLKQFKTALELNPYLVPAMHGVAFHDTTTEADKLAMVEKMEQLRNSNWEDEARDTKHSEQGRYATVISTAPTSPPTLGPPPKFESSITWTADASTKWDDATRDRRSVNNAVNDMRIPHGVSITLLDYDGDGRIDVYVPARAVRNSERCDVLLRNTGSGFADVSVQVGLVGLCSHCASAADYNNDGKTDLVLATETGLKLLRNSGTGFVDATPQEFIAKPGVYSCLRWLDIDQDGDLDVIAGRYSGGFQDGKQLPGGELLVFQNIGVAPPSRADEPTPALTTAYKLVDNAGLKCDGMILGVACLDMDGDKDIDLVVYRYGRTPTIIFNDRLMRFHSTGGDEQHDEVVTGAIVLDANGDEQSDLLEFGAKQPLKLSTTDRPGYDLKRFRPTAPDLGNTPKAVACDLDQDGRMDFLICSGGDIVCMRGTGTGDFAPLPIRLPKSNVPLNSVQCANSADFNGDGLPDLCWMDRAGIHVLLGESNGNHGLYLKFTGVRDNSNGGSGQKNLRCNTDGLGVKCRTVTGALRSMVEHTGCGSAGGQSSIPLHIGVGSKTQADAVRIRWPDCVVQAEVNVPAGKLETIREVNRKPTSCPVLMTWDGTQWVYVTDFLGVGAIGESGADGSVRPPRPEESVKIEAHQLRQKDGKYRLRIAEPMDEVLYLDHVRLDVIDHPVTSRVYPDERFAVADPQPTQALVQFDRQIALKNVVNQRGVDVTELLAKRDDRTVSDFAKCTWLGFAEEHFVEFEFAEAALESGKPYLILTGWADYAYPESIIAAAQAGIEMLPPLLERKTPQGAWEPLSSIGFPAGLPKPMLAPFEPQWLSAGRYRIRTNLHIHWDSIALGVATAPASVIPLSVTKVELNHPGFIKEILTHGQPPQAYDPNRTEAVAVTRWTGHVTKLGDVTELLAKLDDRLVLCGPGDELLLEFDASRLPAIPSGCERSFVLRTHGYCKDTAPTTQSGGSVNPLPYRAMANYPHRTMAPADGDRVTWHTRPAYLCR